MNFELGKVYSGYEFLEVASVASKDVLAYRVRNTFVRRLELLYILPAQSDPQQVDRFMREMRVRASLLHPNIVTLFNAGEMEGHLIMTTELVGGTTLASRLAEGPLPWTEAAALVRQALSALACAHALGVVHRDLSPGNILIAPSGVLKLSNFGLAKTADSPQLTKAGVIIGNLRYIPPEQVRGTGELDARSDIYSLGAVLYEMLCGRPPFDCKSEFELMLAHVNTPPVPVTELNAEVPAALNAAVMKALAKAPAARFQSAAEFDRAVEAAAVLPVVVEAAAPPVEAAAVLPVVIESPAPPIEEGAMPPVVVETPAPPIDAVAVQSVVIEAQAPLVEEGAGLPAVIEAPAPLVEEAAMPPVMVEAPAPPVEEAAMPPVVVEAAAPPVEEVGVSPVVDIVPEEEACVALPPPLPEPFDSAAYSAVWPQAAAQLSEVMPEPAVPDEPAALPPPLPGPPPLPELTQPASLDETAELARVIPFPVRAEHSESASAEAEPLFAATPKGPRMQWALLGGTAAGIMAGVLAIWLATGK